MDRHLRADNLIFFEPDENIGAGFEVQFLEKFVKTHELSLDSKEGGHKALALTYTLRRFSDGLEDILKEPVPQVQIVDCEDKKSWRKQLWELND